MIPVLLVLASSPIIWRYRKNKYFKSDEFNQLRGASAALVREHNDIVDYIRAMRAEGSFELGHSASGQHAHLAHFGNTSSWNYQRDRHVASYAPNTHNASLQVVRSASREPLKYLMKYFNIRADVETLADVQRLALEVSRLEEAVRNVKQREAVIQSKIHPPQFILDRYASEFWNKVGVELSPITVPYQTYIFEYVSAGGNSGQQTTITLNTPTLDALSTTLDGKIRWVKSAAGQRALMTAALREAIKKRDSYTCQSCSLSVAREPNLLLEIDHIIPVSRGGLSQEDNLQTLCWRCNRAKGARMPPGVPPRSA